MDNDKFTNISNKLEIFIYPVLEIGWGKFFYFWPGRMITFAASSSAFLRFCFFLVLLLCCI